MKVKAILCVLSIFILFGCMHLFEGTINRHMNEEQKRQFEQNREMVRLVIKNSTSSTVYLVIDYMGHGNIPPGRRVSRSVAAGSHTLEAYDENGRIKGRVRIYLRKSDRYTWSIGE